MEAMHPFLESAAVGVDVLDGVDARDDADTGGQVHRTVRNAHRARHRAEGLTALDAENGVTCQERLECGSDVFLVRLHKHKVGGVPGAVPAHQHRNLFVGPAALRRLAAPRAGRTRKPAFLALGRGQEVGFVSLGNARKRGRLLGVGQVQEAIAPAEGGVAMHFARRRAPAHATALCHVVCVFQPLVLVPQTGQRRPRQALKVALQAPQR